METADPQVLLEIQLLKRFGQELVEKDQAVPPTTPLVPLIQETILESNVLLSWLQLV